MSTHFRWYPASEEQVVPWNARYEFPSQANKCVKITPRLPPKNGGEFLPGQVIRLEFPAQGFCNAINTTLEFDVVLYNWGTPGNGLVRFQNNIQSIFNRVRILYGATPLEDLINYNQIIRNLTEWTCTNQNGSMDQVSISEGIGGVVMGQAQTLTPRAPGGAWGLVNTRESYIQGYSNETNSAGSSLGTGVNFDGGNGFGTVPNSAASGACIRRYQVNLALGLLTQDKLLPVKFMASQLAIEITLEQPSACIFAQPGSGAAPQPTYKVNNINLIPEILEFDASYDAMFLKGLQAGGVPLKFSSWHTFIFTTAGASNVNLQVQERSRSVKALFTVQRRSPYQLDCDSGATFFDTDQVNPASGTSMSNYQYRIGGRYFPAQPVQLSTSLGSNQSNGGSEAFVELQKALNIVGDYRLSSSVNTNRWALSACVLPPGPTGFGSFASSSQLAELDYCTSIAGYNSYGNPMYGSVTNCSGGITGNCFGGNLGSSCYVSAIDLETSNGIEISGLNAEEQSDIAFIANWKTAQSLFNLEVYSYFDLMIILKPNNVLDLIQ